MPAGEDPPWRAMMKRILCLLVVLMLIPGGGSAEIFQIEDESQLPADWANKDLLRLTMIDTDRSDAMLLECGGEAMMLDGGSGQYRERLYDVLDGKGITRLKYLFSSHSDNDHIHGLVYLMTCGKYDIGAFLSINPTSFRDAAGYHKKAVNAAKKMEIPYIQMEEGQTYTLGGATIKVLRCPEKWGANARGATALIQFGDSRVLSPGDIDNRTMKWYAEHYTAEELACDILKIPHHGLAAIPDTFLAAASPEMLIVPNTYKRVYEGKRSFTRWVKVSFEGGPCKYSGDGHVVCVTDGTDWYAWQEPNWKKKK